MIRGRWKTALVLFVAACGTSVFGQEGKDKKPAVPAAKKVTYDDDVRAIFRIRCFSCHNQNMAKSDLALDAYNAVMQGGASGASVVGGDLKKSRLWQLVNHLDSPKMPPEQDKLPAAELAIIQSWIEGGALQNAGASAAGKTMVDLTATAGSGRPAGAPPMPDRLVKEPATLAERPGAVTALAASPWAPLVAVAGVKQILLYNSDSAELLGVLPFPEGQAHVLKFSRSGTLLMAGGGRAGLLGKVVVFDVKTGKRVAEVGDELDVVLAADINDNHTMIALGGPRKIVRVYSVKDNSLLHEIKKHTDWIYAIEFSPDGVLLATADRSSGLFVWESETAREYLALRGHTGAVTDVSWRLDSNLLASSGEDGAVRLWESQNGGQVRAWTAHGGGAAAVRFTHDGRLVSTGRDRVTKVWDGNGAQQRAFDAHGDIGLKVAFTHDGKRVVAGDWTGEIRLWDVADGKRVANLAMNPPTLAVQMDNATKSLAAQQAEQQKLTVAYQAAQSAFEKAQADLAAAQKAVTTAQALVGTTAAAAAAGKATLAQATTIQAAAAKATADFEAQLNAAKAAAVAAQAAAAKAPQDKNLADQAARLNTELEVKTAQLEAARKVAADKTAGLEKAKQASAQADAAAAAAAAAVPPAQQKVAALTPTIKPAQDAAAAAKAKADAAAAAVPAAQQLIERLKQDIAFAQQAKVAGK